MRHVKASEFKAKCHAFVDAVARTGKPIVITKKGRPLAELHPHRPRKRKDAFGVWKDVLIVKGDVIAPLGVDWHSSKQA